MSQDGEKYLYFKVGLLKDSFALEALWQDALKYHMIDQPAKLIALRLTEYYELTKKDIAHPTASTSMSAMSTGLSNRGNREDIDTPTTSSPAIRPSAIRPPATSSSAAHSPVAHPPLSSSAAISSSAMPASSTKATSTTVDQAGSHHPEAEGSLTVSAEVDQNAEDAADYWSIL